MEAEQLRSSHYSDETQTGETCQELRGLRRTTIAARCQPDANGFDWVRRFHADHAPEFRELKSSLAIEICHTNPRAHDFLIRHVSDSTIFVISLFEDLYRTLTFLRDIAPDANNAVESLLKSGRIPHELVTAILQNAKHLALMKSLVPEVQHLVDLTGILDRDGNQLSVLDSDAIARLNAQQFTDLVTRFTVAFADVADPRMRAKAISHCFAATHLGQRSYLASMTLAATQSHDLVFDMGGTMAISMLNEANDVVAAAVHAAELQSLKPQRRIEHQDSRHVLGVQAADLAAGYARYVFEQTHEGNALLTAKRLRNYFGAVFYNGTMLE